MKTKLIAVPKHKDWAKREEAQKKIFGENMIQLFFNPVGDKLEFILDPSKKCVPTYFFSCYEHKKATVISPKILNGFTKELK